MPSKNSRKEYLGESYYHVYNRGINKQTIFHDSKDYSVFLNLLKRYLSKEAQRDDKGREYESLRGRLKLLSFCLMPNHFHLFLYQEDDSAITRLLRGVGGSYAAYYNKRYKRIGPLFQERYRASLINNDAYLTSISRYIHRNPKNYMEWEWSSLPYYLGSKEASWVSQDEVMSIFNDNRVEYMLYMEDFEIEEALESLLADK